MVPVLAGTLKGQNHMDAVKMVLVNLPGPQSISNDKLSPKSIKTSILSKSPL